MMCLGGRARGAALLLVLWLIVLLMAVIGVFVFGARTEAMEGHLARDDAMARQIARAGIEYAVARVSGTDIDARWVADGRDHHWKFADADVTIRIVDETGKVDVNRADARVLAALLRQAGAAPDQARRIAAAMIDWRDADDLVSPDGAEASAYAAAGLDYAQKNAPFESVAEVEQVLGMTPALYASIAPSLTLYGHGLPDPQFAPELVLRAVGEDPAPWLARRAAGVTEASIPRGSGTYSVDSRVCLADGRCVGLRRTVRAGVGAPGRAAYVLLQQEDVGNAGE